MKPVIVGSRRNWVPAAVAVLAGILALGPALADPQPVLVSSRAASPAPDRSYRIHEGDELDFSVLGHDELKATVTVLSDGSCAFPGAGTVHAAGLTELDLTGVLESKLSSTINQPTATVIVHPNSNANKVSVIGAVKSPGQYAVESSSHLVDVIAMAGGLNQEPVNTDILVVHPGGADPQKVDVPALMSVSDRSQNVPVGPGDVILVQAPDAKWLSVQIAGEVTHPGAYEVTKDGVLLPAALAMAGGTVQDAALTKAQILHNGQVQTVNLKSIVENLSDPSAQIRLMPGDVLQVPAILSKYAVIGEVKTPGPLPVPEAGHLTVSRAIVEAGGTLDDADLAKVSLARQDANGQLVTTQFDLGKLLAGKVPDMPVERGDVIYVPAKKQNNDSLDRSVGILGGLFGIFNFLK